MAPWLAFSLVEENIWNPYIHNLHRTELLKNIKTYKTWITNTKEKLNEEEKCTYTTEQIWKKKKTWKIKKWHIVN